jgi:hypothetical protein
MKYLFLFCFFYLSISVQAQLLTKQEVLCKNIVTGGKVNGTVYQFEQRIDEVYIDTFLQAAIVQLRGLTKRKKKPLHYGSCVYLDLAIDSIAWSKEVLYEEEEIRHFPGVIIKEKIHKNRTFLLEPKTGIATKEIVQNIFYVSPSNNLGIGYDKRITANPSLLYGVDLNTNTVLWERKVNRKFGLSECIPLNDSTLLLSASGLHSLNIGDGRGWGLELVTGEQAEDNSKYVGIGVAFGLIGVLVASAIDEKGGTSADMITKIRGVESNILIDKGDIYYASKYEVFKLSKEGNILWSTQRDEESSSYATIFIEGDFLFMVNNGTAFLGSKTVKYGEPGFVAFDKRTGEETIKFPFRNFIDGVVMDYRAREDEVVVMATEKLVQVMTDRQIKWYNFPHLKKEKFIGFLDENNFTITEDGRVIKTTDYYPNDYHLITNKKTIHRLDENLEEKEVKLVENIWNQVAVYKSLRILYDDETVLIIDETGRKITSFFANPKFMIFENQLYFTQGNKLKILDLSSF